MRARHAVLSFKENQPTLLTNMREPCETATQMPGVSRLTTYRLVRAGKLTLVKLGTRASAITDDSLCDFIASHTLLVVNGSQAGSWRENGGGKKPESLIRQGSPAAMNA